MTLEWFYIIFLAVLISVHVLNFQLLRGMHSLWSPSISQVLPGEIKAAMTMSDVERYSLLGEENPKLQKGSNTFTDGSNVDMNKEGHAEPNESDIRNWFKGIRDSG